MPTPDIVSVLSVPIPDFKSMGIDTEQLSHRQKQLIDAEYRKKVGEVNVQRHVMGLVTQQREELVNSEWEQAKTYVDDAYNIVQDVLRQQMTKDITVKPAGDDIESIPIVKPVSDTETIPITSPLDDTESIPITPPMDDVETNPGADDDFKRLVQDPIQTSANPEDYKTLEEFVKGQGDKTLKNLVENKLGVDRAYYENMEMVKVSDIEKYAEYDRLLKPQDKNRYEKLKTDIKENGMKDGIILEVGAEGKAKITEGNHRLAVAKELGMEYIPVQIHRASLGVSRQEQGLPLQNIKIPETAYYSQNNFEKASKVTPRLKATMKPSDMGFNTLEQQLTDIWNKAKN